MKISDEIKKHVNTIMKSQTFHNLIIEGRPGTGKTTAVCDALMDLSIKPAVLGSYSTPLGLFNFMFENQDGLLLIDDTSSLFGSAISMGILKSATWDLPEGDVSFDGSR